MAEKQIAALTASLAALRKRELAAANSAADYREQIASLAAWNARLTDAVREADERAAALDAIDAAAALGHPGYRAAVTVGPQPAGRGKSSATWNCAR